MSTNSIIVLMHHRHELLDISKYPLKTLTDLLHKILLLPHEPPTPSGKHALQLPPYRMPNQQSIRTVD
jgi:hypothetical protein